jgi:GTPase SAR1 family protein
MLDKENKDNIPSGFSLYDTLQASGQAIHRVAWSPDGTTLASTYRNEQIRIWDITTKSIIHSFPGKLNYSIAWSPDGQKLVWGDRSFLFILDTVAGELQSTLKIPNKVNKSVAWSPKGHFLASGSDDNSIRLWNPTTGQLLCEFTGHSKGVNSIAWSPDGRTLASGSDDNSICLWNPVTEQLIDTFVEHADSVNTIAWSPDGQTFASASNDNTIRIWDFEERRLSAIFEGHTKAVICITFSYDGRLLASKSLDGTVRLWQCDTGKELVRLDEPAYGWYAGLAFHPNKHRLATLGEKDTIIRIWDLDIQKIFSNSSESAPIQYRSAKVVLVGDSGVGKTCLSLALTGRPFVSTASTHGRSVQLLNKEEVNLPQELKEARETLLWDLAGQEHYRLIHQLYLHEASLALIVFNAFSDIDPLAGVNYWAHVLKLAQLTRTTSTPFGNPTSSVKSFLVATHVDLSETKANYHLIDEIAREVQADAYFETSAKENIGITALTSAIISSIDWEMLPKVSSVRLFQTIKDFIVLLKERNWELHTIDNLYRNFLGSQPEMTDDEELRAQFETCLTHMEAHDLIKKLNVSAFVLLRPELLDGYASSLIDAVSSDPDGLGSIPQEKVYEGNFYIPSDYRLKDRGLEKILLIEMVSYLQHHEIVLREDSDDGPYLVFPSLATREISDTVDIGKRTTIFRFKGPVLNIYATLAVRLSHSLFFTRREIGKDTITFTYSFPSEEKKDPICVIFLQNGGDGIGELTLSFNKDADSEIQQMFAQYVEAHLRSHALPASIQREPIQARCSNCGEMFSEMTIKRRRERGFGTIRCSVCDTIALIDKDIGKILSKGQSTIYDMDDAANTQRNYEINITNLRGTSQAKITRGDYDVFLCYNHDDEAGVKKIRQQLMTRGLAPWFDEHDLRPGLPRQRQLEQQIKNIKSAAVFIGKTGIKPWQELQSEAFLREFVNRGCPVIPVLLPDAPHKPDLPGFLEGMAWVDFRPAVREPYIPLDPLLLEWNNDNEPNSNQDSVRIEEYTISQGQDPMDLLVWGITGERAVHNVYKDILGKIKEKVVIERMDNYMIDSIEEKHNKDEYDVFISYNHKDREAVKRIGELLKSNGLAPWLDEWDLQPGLSWLRLVMQQIPKSKSAAIFISDAGIGPWQWEEMEAFMLEYVKRKCPTIPVLLPNAPENLELPPFLNSKTWVDFRKKDPDPLKRLIWGITGHKPDKVYRPGILVASLGESPAVIPSMYRLLTEKEQPLTIEQVTILRPTGDEVKLAYELVEKFFPDKQKLHPEPTEFEDADSWQNACRFLNQLCRLLDHYQKQGETVYLSLAGGRKSMAALMAWVVPYFSCVQKLYHVVDQDDLLFKSASSIKAQSSAVQSRLMEPDLKQLSLVEIPFERDQKVSEKLFSRLLSPETHDYEKAEALITGQVILQQSTMPLISVTKPVVEQFRELCKRNSNIAQEVRNGLLEMSKFATLQAYKNDPSSESFKGKRLHYFTELSGAVCPVFYTLPEDPDAQVEQVVICSLEERGTNGYKTLPEVKKSPNFALSHKVYSPIDVLPPVPFPAKSVLIVPLGKSPMIATQLYTLLREQEKRTIDAVVLVYPALSPAINNSADIVESALSDEYNFQCTRIGIPNLKDITSIDDCTIYQRHLETEIERVKQQYPPDDYTIDLALSGGRKGMTAMTIFAAQNKQIPYVYHTLITNEDINEQIEEETTIETLNSPRLSQQARNDRLFLRKYKTTGDNPYANFTLFRVPVFTADGW